ncbi:hypothetical protein PHSC3_001240 [Chlamydiales bacterium STE3]|nr:hypothetical protein PHSC3_001240 [Chlamydiales bacterium STE3]
MAYELSLKQQIYLRILLNYFHGEQQEALLKGLPPPQAREIAGLNIDNNDPSLIFLHPQEAIGSIHYSWIAEEIKKQPSTLQRFFISAATPTQQLGLTKLLGKNGSGELAPALSVYFCYQLYISLEMQNLLPKPFLPKTPLLRLLQLSKTQLVTLIDFFGLYDLAEEMRTIVNTKNLKNIHACLSPKKHQFLRICLHLKERLVAPKLQLDKWDGNCQELQKRLHRRGLSRLGKALMGQNPDFIWYLVHTLDIGRGKILVAQAPGQELPGIASLLQTQLLNLIDFLEGAK